MKILVCEPGKHPYVKDIEHTLENLQAEVDGNIQAIYPFEEQVGLIVNEEGLFRDDLAWNRTVEKYGPIKGTFFVCGLGFEDFTGLTDEQIEKYKEQFNHVIVNLPGIGLIAVRETKPEIIEPDEDFEEEPEIEQTM